MTVFRPEGFCPKRPELRERCNNRGIRVVVNTLREIGGGTVDDMNKTISSSTRRCAQLTAVVALAAIASTISAASRPLPQSPAADFAILAGTAVTCTDS